MELIESAWFFSMVEKRAASPQERLLAVFSVVSDWMSAPGIHAQLVAEQISALPASSGLRHLTEFMTRHAQAANANNPAALSQQLSLLLIGAIAEQLRHPERQVINDAAEAARVLVSKACSRRLGTRWTYLGGIAATLMVSVIAWMLLPQHTPPAQLARAHTVSAYHMVALNDKQLSPDEIEAVLALHDQIVRGECRAPHMAMLPPAQAVAYMNVVEARKPEDPVADRASIRAFMAWFNSIHATECYPPHTNDHINTTWVRKTVS